MNNLEVSAIREFRRFANTYIYPISAYIIMTDIQRDFNINTISYNPLPQPIIKFDSGIKKDMNTSLYTEKLHIILKGIFMNYFNNSEVVKLIRNKIFTDIVDNDQKQLLNLALSEIQLGNPQYVSLLFNITILDTNVYLYL